MEKDKRKNYIFWAKLINPVVLVVYGILCFYLYSLSQYGGVKRKVPIILGCMLALLIWVFWCFYRKYIKQKANQEKPAESKKAKIYRIWFFIACLIMLATTLITAAKIYESAKPYNGRLSWWIQDIKNKRQVVFVENNIYENNIEGIFDAIKNKVTLPEELYVSSDFQLKFNEDGEIISFDNYLYGENEKGEIESFLITYDENKSKKIIIYLKGVVNVKFNEEKKLQPFIDMMKSIPIKETISEWDQERYGILYSGIRNWGYNTDGIIYIDENGHTRREESPLHEIIGYTISLYVPEKEELYMPVRFIMETDDILLDGDDGAVDDWDIGYSYNEGEETFFFNEDTGYQLRVVDAALGSRFYALFQTQDGGTTWESLNLDPFSGNTGVSAGITFINEKLGFIGLSHNGGDHAELYQTSDGGLTYKEVSLPDIEVSLTETEKYNPFDFPNMPYEKNGQLVLLVGQGQDGDYKGGSQALYQSEDNGKTWEYVKEVRQ